MNSIVLFFILVTKLTSGFIQSLTFPVDEDSKYDSICENASVIINFSGLDLNNIKENFLSSPVVYCLDLSDNHIKSVDDNAFTKLPNLKYLNMSNNEFDINNILSHGRLNNLETLILDNNKNCRDMQSVNLNTTYPKLKRLFIRNNCGNIYFQSSFKNAFPSLTHLYLNGSSMDTANTDPFFQWLPNTLEYLDLSGHNLSGITLRNLDNLQYLIISEPCNKRLITLNLQGLINLKYLSAASNGLADYVEFPIVPSLIFLDISNNNIRLLQRASIYHMTNLQFLDLSGNCIQEIEEGAFDRLVNLEVLVLKDNKITEIPTISNEKLSVLFLNCNKLKRIAAGAFKKMIHLESLHLDGNKISYVDEAAFIGLGNLQTLTLSNNLLTSLPHNWMLPIVSITFLNLGNNRFFDFTNLALSESSPLEVLYLSTPLTLNPTKYLNRIPENVTIFVDSFIEKCTKNNKQRCGY